jgi:exodeoxyribonuclease V beta subunit
MMEAPMATEPHGPPRSLDVLQVPLRGSRLIEASAGTGKTWTIAALYLRLVLGHGGPEAGAAAGPLAPADILVLTFTRAATRELSDRIRRRLLEAARVFREAAEGDPPPQAGLDPLLLDLLAAHPPGAPRAHAAWRLAAAAEGMDDAAIHTIDAWCQRMLREHAFDSGSLFDEELLTDEQALLKEAVQDHWRQQVYPLDGEVLDAVLAVWPHVDVLLSDVRGFLRLRHDLPEVDTDESLAALLARHTAAHTAALAGLKSGWRERSAAMKAWLQGQLERDDCPFDRKKMQARHALGWLDALAAWADSPDQESPKLTDTARHRLQPAGLREALKAELDLPDDFEQLARLLRDLADLPALAPALRLHAAVTVARRMAWLKQQAGTCGFDDLLQRLDAALRGPNAERLRARILAQHPVALIDEFQDTSPLQSRIFDSLYDLAGNDPSTAVFLIGDPKQSIYGFRGADIHSYLGARRATEGRHEVLGTNHRSTRALVEAVNRLFERAERRPGEGAFMFRSADADRLPFVPVEARGRAEALVSRDGPVPAMTWCFDPEPCNKARSLRAFAARCAERIVALLNDPQAGFAQAEGGGFTRLRPADIAVLVRERREAEAVRRELRLRQVASVYLSDKHSVFASREAQDLLRWLRAVAEPRDTRLARAALATATVGLSLDELARLADSDEAFEARAEQFRQLHQAWLEQGVLTMLRQTLHRLSLPARWLTSVRDTDGERRLTNFLHLAELLQNASARLDGEQALIRWLALQMENRSAALDEQIVRLESDADLVQVVTVHKSKGLEYPVVFLPFACSAKPVQARNTPLVVQVEADGTRRLRTQVTPGLLAEADRERQREDLRLLYVALTRARHAVWAGVGIVQPGNRKDNEVHLSALGQLLTGPAKVRPDELGEALGELSREAHSVRVEAVGPGTALPAVTLLQERDAGQPLQPSAPYDGRFERRWAIGSFSALVRNIPSAAAPPKTVAESPPSEESSARSGRAGGAVWTLAAAVREDELMNAPEEGLPAAQSATAPWHAFPRGATPGNFLHDQLEWLAAEDFALDTSPALQQQLLRRCERQGFGHRGADVLAWLRKVTSRRLPPLGASLAELRVRLPEMEFWLPSRSLPSARIDELCRLHLLHGRPRPALPQRELRGLLMGFADLVFEHGGRYWVLDYKSNYLGPRDADYDADALEAAMAGHRYDVQAGLYLLALHRLLRRRLGDAYRPEAQLGGAVYLFLRGLHGPEGGCCTVPADPAFLDALDRSLGDRDGADAP